jgi:hypothetical protein
MPANGLGHFDIKAMLIFNIVAFAEDLVLVVGHQSLSVAGWVN